MSATNHTSNYELSQYIGSDEPKYLTDYNGDMQKIDVAIKDAKTSADTANTGVATNAASIQTLDGAISSLNGQVSTVATDTNGNTASINTINSLIGNGEPTTSDKTIIGAINEIYADITGGGTDIEADNVEYDNTTSGLTATNVQSAIDEVLASIPTPGQIEADDIAYDNQTSGLTATDVQSAIDEVNDKITGEIYDLDLGNSVTATLTGASTLGIDSNNSDVKVLTNADGSIGKIYGGISTTNSLTVTGSTVEYTKIATISASNLPAIDTAYDIAIGYTFFNVSGAWSVSLTKLHFNTDGTVDVYIRLGAGTYENFRVSLAPCLYFLKDLGD